MNLKKTFKELKFYEWIMIAIMMIIAIYTLTLSIIDPLNSSNPIWLAIINCISAMAGVICVFFVEKAGISNFIFATINTITYIVFLYYHL